MPCFLIGVIAGCLSMAGLLLTQKWHRHSWGKWQEFERGRITQKDYDDKTLLKANYIVQSRQCDTCKLLDFKQDKISGIL